MLKQLSFWKSFSENTNDNIIIAEELKSIGKLDDVMWRLKNIPHMYQLPRTVNDILKDPDLLRYQWRVENGVFLFFNIELNSKKEDEVMVIRANSSVSMKSLLSLYVQMFEHLEVILLDEATHKFLSIKDLRAKLV